VGGGPIVSQSESCEDRLEQILEALAYLKRLEFSCNWNTESVEIEESAQYKGLDKFKVTEQIKCTCFSDSIFVSIPVSPETVNEVATVLIANLAKFGADLLAKKILVRGGITVGNLVHSDDGVIVGKA
jgi:hypothetical protein